jgi:hypothetical protein
VIESQGSLQEAAGLFAEAAQLWAAFPHVLEHGYALLGLGRCLLQGGYAAAARRSLQEARDVFNRLGANPLLAQVDDLLVLAAF